MPRGQYPPLGAEMFDKLMQEWLEWGLELKNRLVQDLLANGRPPGTVEASPRQEYENLVTMQTMGDRAFTAEARERLLELQQQFGMAPRTPFIPYDRVA